MPDNASDSARVGYLEMAKSDRRKLISKIIIITPTQVNGPPSLYRLETNLLMAYIKVAMNTTKPIPKHTETQYEWPKRRTPNVICRSESESESELFYSANIQHSITMVMYKKKKKIINADMEAPIKTNYWSLS